MTFQTSTKLVKLANRLCKQNLVAAIVATAATLTLCSGAMATTDQSSQKIIVDTTETHSIQAKSNRPSRRTQVLRFDVAEDATRFVFDDAPLLNNGFPAYGNSFVTQGYIYPAGTLNGSNGVNVDGSPEFPELVQGRWVCRGWIISEEGAVASSGEFVITQQLYNFGEALGNNTLVSDGWEIADVGEPVARAITGGTGRYSNAGGEAVQRFLGFNASEGVNLTFEMTVEQ